MTMKSLLAPLALLAAAVLPLSAAEPLEIWISSQQDKAYYEAMATAYAATNEGFEARVTAYGFQELPEKLGFALKAGEGVPDIVQIDEALFGAFLEDTPPFVDLAPRMKEADLEKDFSANRLKLFAHDGRQYGLPQSLSAYVLYYRTDLFKAYGLTPDDLKTWDAAERVGRALHKDHGVSLLSMDPSYFEVLLRQQGGDVFGRDGAVLPDFDQSVKLLEWMADITEEGVAAMPERGSIFDPLFFSGQLGNDEVLTVMGAGWFGLDMLPQFADQLEGKWGIMPLPAWKEGGLRTSCFAGQGLMIVRGTEQEEVCWDFLHWVMTDKEANAQRFLMGNSFPAYKPAWKDERLHKPGGYFGEHSLGKVLAELAPDVPETVMHPKRPLSLFLMQEQYFSGAIYKVETAKDLLEGYRRQLRD